MNKWEYLVTVPENKYSETNWILSATTLPQEIALSSLRCGKRRNNGPDEILRVRINCDKSPEDYTGDKLISVQRLQFVLEYVRDNIKQLD